MAQEATSKTDKKENLIFGGMARWDGLDLFGPNYTSIAYRKDGKVHVKVESSKAQKIKDPTIERISRLPLIRSFFFWGRLLVQAIGSIWTLLFFAATLGILWLMVRLFEMGSGDGALGGALGFFAQFPILPLLLVFFGTMKFTSIGRYHGAEHKSVAAYERYGEVTLDGARRSKRVHPRCGTNILIYILVAALLDPLIGWWGYAVLQFILISEAWYIFGQSRLSIAVGNFLQRYVTTSEPRRSELEVAVESMNQLLQAERKRAGSEAAPATARF